jgi:hypothetical protein
MDIKCIGTKTETLSAGLVPLGDLAHERIAISSRQCELDQRVSRSEFNWFETLSLTMTRAFPFAEAVCTMNTSSTEAY